MITTYSVIGMISISALFAATLMFSSPPFARTLTVQNIVL